MKEKKLIRQLALAFLAVLAVLLTVSLLVRLLMPHGMKETLFNLSQFSRYSSAETAALDDFTFRMDPEGLLTVKSVELKKDVLLLNMEARGKETGDVFLSVLLNETGEEISSTLIHVNSDGTLWDRNTGNYSFYRFDQVCIVLLFLSFAILLWIGYWRSSRQLGFSYQAIFCFGLGLWLSLQSLLLMVTAIQNHFMIGIYSIISQAPIYFVFITFPLVLIFAVSLVISNLSLIRHEGFQFSNILGTLISLVMVGGFFILFFISPLFSAGSWVQVNLWSSFMAVSYALYAILECFLLGSIVCGLQAALHKPVYDKDYIVILGCMIRKDGTLYPLIRGRVDRAIRFYREQLKATGKKAVFIPSGGQGADEIISEAEAMKRYLVEQGIEPEQILLEDRSKNTIQNMTFSKELIQDQGKAVFSTTNFHVFRSGIIARQAGFDADGMGSHTKWYFWPNAFVREMIGMLSYKWKELLLLFVTTASLLTAFIFFSNL